LLNGISEMVATARAMPMSSSVLVHREELSELVARAQQALPGELATADAILGDADAVLKQAQEEKAATLAAARQEADELVSREKVVIKAREEAQKIVADAKAE